VSIAGPSEPTPAQPGRHLPSARRRQRIGYCGLARVLDWIKDFLASSRAADVRAKVAATGAAERHALVGASFTTPGDAYFALGYEHRRELPPADPCLPREITHLWVWATPGMNGCLAWFPERGWLDVMDHWATP
jgi:hypothetical protein